MKNTRSRSPARKREIRPFVNNMIKSSLKKENIVRNSEEKPLQNGRQGGIIPM